MRFSLQFGVAAVVLTSATTAQAQNRFQGMDTNRDGVITRSEWRGNNTSFRNQDWNNDGVLSGDEVRTGARKSDSTQDSNRDGREDNRDSEIGRRFRGHDLNNDGWVTRSEWNLGNADFIRLDLNRDNRISRVEFESDTASYNDDRYAPAQFGSFDTNRDGWLTRPESRMGSVEFDSFDANRDNRISRYEFENLTTAPDPSHYDRFATFDVNGDDWLTRSEWRGNEAGFTRLDTNRDNRLSRSEYDATVATEPARSAAWRAGHDKGSLEGRLAGREDHTRRQGWDLDGQRELERADSGYTPQVGTLSDYQTGYREGFKAAYRAGFIAAGGRAPR